MELKWIKITNLGPKKHVFTLKHNSRENYKTMLSYWINVGKGDKIPQNKYKINHKIGVYQISPHLNQACPHAKIKKEEKGINIYSMQTN